MQALVYSGASKQLISTADDKILGIWDMAATRQEVNIYRLQNNIQIQINLIINLF